MNRRTFYTLRAMLIAASLIGIHPACNATERPVETLVEGLHNPQGVAIRPSVGSQQQELFVADTGAGRIVKLRGNESAPAIDVITGFAADAEPTLLHFLDRDHLVVATSGHPAIRVFELSDQPAPLAPADAKQEVDQAAIGAIHGLARTRQNDKVPDLLVVACENTDWPSGLGRIAIRAGTLDKLARLSRDPAPVGSPRGAAVGEHGYIAVVYSDPSNKPHSVLTFHEPATGALVASFPVELSNLRGLAYQPTSDDLYTLGDGADGDHGGLYRLEDASQPGKPACRAVQITTIGEPTAFAFAPNGTIYITTTGDKNGKLLRITGDQ
jgi:hypothetical protein